MGQQSYQQKVEQSVEYLQSKISATPEIVILLGTGLGELAGLVRQPTIIPYEQIPHFPRSTVTSHAGNLLFGVLAGKNVAIMQGRFHYYEGYSTKEVTFPLRVASLLGAKTAIITNASGGLRSDMKPGTIMVVRDHINLLPENPLRGPNVDEWGERFPDLSSPYLEDLREKAFKAAEKSGIANVTDGTYVCIAGPSLETPAETRYLKIIGADAVGMSSVPEVIVAIHSGMKVLGLSVVANVNDPDNFQPILLDDIVQAAGEAGARLQQLITTLLPEV